MSECTADRPLFRQEVLAAQQGQVLARLHSERLTTGGDTALLHAQALAQRRASLETERLLTPQQAQQHPNTHADRLRSLTAEERQLASELDMARHRSKLARQSEQRMSELALSGFISTAQAQQSQKNLLDLQGRERSMERALSALQREQHATQAEAQGAPETSWNVNWPT